MQCYATKIKSKPSTSTPKKLLRVFFRRDCLLGRAICLCSLSRSRNSRSSSLLVATLLVVIAILAGNGPSVVVLEVVPAKLSLSVLEANPGVHWSKC